MLSLGLGQWQPAWVFVCFIAVQAVLGSLSGLLCVRLALIYIHLLAQGRYPDTSTFWMAMRSAVWLPGSTQNSTGQRGYAQGAWGNTLAMLMAVVVPLLYWRIGWSLYFVALSLAALVLLTLALIDAACGLLPDALTLPLLWGGLVVSWLGYGPSLHNAVAGAMLGYGFPWVIFFVYKCVRRCDGMGHGDFKLLAVVGTWLGWQAVLPVLLLASVGLVVLAMFRQKTWRPVGEYPFGPFLIVSAMGFFVFGSGVHSWFI